MTGSDTASPSPSSSPFTAASPGKWDPLVDMQRLQTEMNTFFRRAMDEFGTNPNFQMMRNEPGFSSSLDVRDKGDRYEVHASLPDVDVTNVKVTAESNNLLKLSVSQSKQERKTDKLTSTLMSEFGQYEQLITLPGPARTKDMKVEHKEHEVVVSIPKKK
ncbi:MAG TPA: Hsp20/alpha crystallin family protein [Candidatus Udaeobacter sp.]